MAALDFPNPPLTVGQLYNGTNGVTYQWDGTVWSVPLGGAQLWSVSGSTLTPTDATKTVTIPGTSGGVLLLGSQTAKARITGSNSGAVTGSIALSANRDWITNTYDDAAKVSWLLALREDADFFQVQRWPAGSNTAANLLTLDATGTLTVANPLKSSSGSGGGSIILASGYSTTRLIVPGTISANYFWSGTWQRDDTAKMGAYLQLDPTTGNMTYARDNGGGPVNLSTLDTNGNYTIAGATAVKASGTAWSNPSDERMKRNIANYGTGLAAITQLRPVSFEYNGEFGSVDDGKTCYGFIAQEVEPVMPECVGQMDYVPPSPQTPPGEESPIVKPAPITIKTLDQSNMLLALINAVKELATRVVALEAA